MVKWQYFICDSVWRCVFSLVYSEDEQTVSDQLSGAPAPPSDDPSLAEMSIDSAPNPPSQEPELPADDRLLAAP